MRRGRGREGEEVQSLTDMPVPLKTVRGKGRGKRGEGRRERRGGRGEGTG